MCSGVQLKIFEPPRFFEAFLRGRDFSEAPDITARICGICPVAYQMSSVHAIERAFGVSVGGQLRAFALILLVVGNLALGNRPSRWAWGEAEMFTLGATLIWAVEAVLARKFLSGGMSAPVAAAGRMGFGAIVMLGYVAATGRLDTMASMDAAQWGWVVLTAAFLGAYVLSYYSALKAAPAVLVSSVLVVGSVITAGLQCARREGLRKV